MSDDWPPDWRTRKADAHEAIVIRLGLILSELDELEQLFPDDAALCSSAQQLAGRVRTLRNEEKSQMDTYRVAASELTQ